MPDIESEPVIHAFMNADGLMIANICIDIVDNTFWHHHSYTCEEIATHHVDEEVHLSWLHAHGISDLWN